MMQSVTENEIAAIIVDAAFAIHTRLGPGLLEAAYTAVLRYELTRRGLHVAIEQPVPLVYDGMLIEVAYKADMIVEDKVIIELKSVDLTAPVHFKQLLTYLRLADKRLGLLINFGAPLIKNGITRVANGMPE